MGARSAHGGTELRHRPNHRAASADPWGNFHYSQSAAESGQWCGHTRSGYGLPNGSTAPNGGVQSTAGQRPTVQPTLPGGPGSPAPGIQSGQLVPFSPWNQTFQAPTAAQAAQTPGYQFEVSQAEQALQNSAAANGDLLSGNTLQSTEQLANNLASTNYQQVYNNALGQYQMGYNQFENNQANQWNRLASIAGVGQTQVNQLGGQGTAAAGNTSNLLLGSGQQIGKNLVNAGNATATGYANAANAYGGMATNLGNLGQLLPYYQMMQQQQASQVPIDQSWMPSNPIPG